MGSCWIRFLMFFFCCSFVFLLFFTTIYFYCSFVARGRSSYLESSFCDKDVALEPMQGMEAVKAAVPVLVTGCVFRLALKVAVGCWIFRGLVKLSLS